MRLLYPTLKYLLLTLLIPLLIASLLGTCVSGLVFEDGNCSPQDDVLRSLTAYGPWAASVFLLLLGMTLVARRDYLNDYALRQFALVKPAELLGPEDFGFEVAIDSKPLGTTYRPFYETYVSREAATENQHGAAGEHSYKEDDLGEELRLGSHFMLIGQPLDGKSRTLFEVLKKVEGHHVLRPSLSKGMPDKEALSLVEGKNVILLLEDLHEYAGSQIDLPELQRAILGRASSCTIAATCREGPELRLVEEKLGRLYEDLDLKLRLASPSENQKGRLAWSIGKEWDPDKSGEYPTLGSIAMERSMEAMTLRFQNLLWQHPDHADILRALKLLTAASVRPLTHRRVKAVSERVFGRSGLHLPDGLRHLSEQSFVQNNDWRNETVYPETAYLSYAVTYTEGKQPEDDFFFALVDTLEELNDAEALNGLGVACLIGGGWSAQAVWECFERATTVDPDFSSAWLNKVALLSAGKYHEMAVAAAERAVELKPENYSYWQQKGTALQNAGRNAEARDAYLRSAEIRPDKSATWRKLGSAYIALDTPRRALSAFNRSIDLGTDYGYAEGWAGRAKALRDLGRDEVALSAYDRAIYTDPNYFEARFNKAGLLRKLARWEEALVAAKEAEKLGSNNADIYTGKGEALFELAKRNNDTNLLQEAYQAYDRATELDEENATSWSMKGVTLLFLERYREAAEVIERAITLRPDRPEDWFHKAQALLKTVEGESVPGPVEYDAGMWWLCRAWLARNRLPDRGASAYRTFQEIGYHPSQCEHDFPVRPTIQ